MKMCRPATGSSSNSGGDCQNSSIAAAHVNHEINLALTLNPTSSLLLAPLSSARPGLGDVPAAPDGPIDGISSARPDRPPICVC